MKNSLNIEITRPTQILYILRGIPGGGKSTKAKTLVGNGVIHSTDSLIEAQGNYKEFFDEMVKNKSFSNLSKMHSLNLENAKKSMHLGISPIIIDNTNLKPSEPKAYLKYALELGYADENIIIVDIGTGDLTAEELFSRGTHGVPLEKIKEMINTYKSVGPLTIDKIMSAKDIYTNHSDISYSAVVLNDESHKFLANIFQYNIPSNWILVAHHMTISFGKAVEDEYVGKNVTLQAYEYGKSDKAMAIKVRGFKSDNKIPHITIAVSPDGKPVMSNDITDWTSITPFEISGIVTNIKK